MTRVRAKDALYHSTNVRSSNGKLSRLAVSHDRPIPTPSRHERRIRRRSCLAPGSDLCSLCQCQGVFHINAEVANRALDLRVAEQDLHGAKIASGLGDDRSLGSPKRMSAIVLAAQTNGGHPFIDQAGELPRAQVLGMIRSARKGVVVECAASPLQPGENARPRWLEQLKLNRLPSLIAQTGGGR